MGHCEMLLAVAGLDEKQIEEKTRLLAEGNWWALSPAEQTAFAFARKLSESPASVGDADVRKLVRHFGPERALDVIWWSCRCHYMTRVADAFQLPLERENVFQAPGGPKKG
jgi:alkylhydroperoxidase family enzyme